MQPRPTHLVCLCLLLVATLAPLWAAGPESRPVVAEFQDTLARIATLAIKPPEALNFPPVQARFVRVDIHETSGNSQPGIDELELFGPAGNENLALAERGAVATASSLLPGYPIHQIKHLNDGRYGNDYSWISATNGAAWAQIELPAPLTVSGEIGRAHV